MATTPVTTKDARRPATENAELNTLLIPFVRIPPSLLYRSSQLIFRELTNSSISEYPA